jgi:replicative DNA helicase
MTTVRPLSAVLQTADVAARGGVPYSATAWATGFHPLDRELSGGLHAGELAILGGPQGTGKTTLALQLARNVVAAGGSATYLCYEHDERMQLQKLIAMEASLADPEDSVLLPRLAEALGTGGANDRGLPGRIGHLPGVAAALAALDSYGDRLRLVTGSGHATDVTAVRRLAQTMPARGLLVVDYLQKVATGSAVRSEDDSVTIIVENLKDTAMEYGVPILAVCAAAREGISEGRTRLRHMRGSTAIAYEADIALVLNDKWHAVARHHLTYGGSSAERFHDWVVCSVEKNRAGRPGADMEFRQRFRHARFEPTGQIVSEELIDERVFRD